MGKRNKEVDDYIDNCAPEHRQTIATVRALIHKIQPGIVESMQYNMPAFACNGTMICGISSRKNYISLYCRPEVVEGHRQALGKLNVGKGCIRFRKLEQISLDAVRVILEESYT